MTTLFNIAQNWLNQDPDAETRAELNTLLDAAKAGDQAAETEYRRVLMDAYNSVLPVCAVVCKRVLWA